jgi:malate dehydrogenase (oxaloacetate-decarboxylating)
MEHYELKRTKDGYEVECSLRGEALLGHPMYNKGTAFTPEERDALGLHGILPPVVCTIEDQVARVYRRISRKTDPLEVYIGLASLQDRNETLFYRLILDNLEEYAPIVYTPTVGKACQMFSTIFRRGRGLWLTPDDKGKIKERLSNARYDDIRLIVVTDNERILGLGDQGAGGIGIPIGKLVLYTVAAGIHPSQVLPISIDVGTDNQELLADDMYIGYRHRRLRGEEYHELIKEFVDGVKACFPKALLQWEDFKKQNAFDNLDKYKGELLSFNDDIQGTAAVALAGIVAATRISRLPMEQQRIVILGAGAAGIGIARQIRDALKRHGVDGDELIQRICILDSRGPLIDNHEFRDVYKKEFAWPAKVAEQAGLEGKTDLADVIRTLKPNVLIGTSGTPGVFTEDVIRAMAEASERPVVFPFSNPTSQTEALPKDVIRWTDGKAIVATGSPFDPVKHKGRTIRIGQGNNVFIFPGVGLGALVAEAREVTPSMFTVAAETLASMIEQSDIDEGALFPTLDRLRDITAAIAVAVAVEAGEEGVAEKLTPDEAQQRVTDTMWTPVYPAFKAI